MTPPSLRVCAYGLSEADAVPLFGGINASWMTKAEASELCKAAGRGDSREANGARILCLVSQPDDKSVAEYFVRPVGWFMELSAHCEFAIARASLERMISQDFTLAISLTTKTAYNVSVARHVALAVASRFGLNEDKTGDIELALHEVLANSLVHGNLEIGSELRRTVSGQDAYIKLMQERLSDPKHSERRILVGARHTGEGIVVSVQDEGPGFDLTKVQKTTESTASGRGLGIIRSLSSRLDYADQGRLARLVFAV